MKFEYVQLIADLDINDSPAGNWTRVSRVTGGDTHHYTTEDMDYIVQLQRLVPEINYNPYVFTGLFTRIACMNRVNI